MKIHDFGFMWAWHWCQHGYWKDASYNNLRIGPLYFWWLKKETK